jgi:hypothetical protein
MGVWEARKSLLVARWTLSGDRRWPGRRRSTCQRGKEQLAFFANVFLHS